MTRGTATPSRILFVAVGEAEVPAFEYIAQVLESEGHICRSVTWLPRLASDRTKALERITPTVDYSQPRLGQEFASQGIGTLSMAADYDRDWHFADHESKSKHVRKVFGALTDVYDAFAPDLVVSSVGGETTRMVSEVIAKYRKVPTAYFNAIPVPGRFTLLRALAAPFVPYPGVDTNYKPMAGSSDVLSSGRNGQPPQKASPAEGFERLWSQLIKREKAYPSTWIPRKAAAVAKEALLRRIPTHDASFDAGHVKVLYPLHDERDFQVAVRERHAVPQMHLLRYLSSELPPNFHLYVKPHPEHSASHHTLLWRNLVKRPNVHFLPPDMSAAEAIENADVIFTLASSLGFEAVQTGKPVVCYGRPFYWNRGVTYDVADPRAIAGSIEASVGTTPDQAALAKLNEIMTEWSWPGQFTPLNLERQNLEKLTVAVKNAIGQL